MATCYIACPAYAMHNPIDRDRVVSRIALIAGELGIEVVPSPLLDRHLGSNAWLPVALRERDLLRALKHDLVWAARGGYGSVHLVERLTRAAARGKPGLIGYSDVTVLHASWRQRGWEEGFYGNIPTRTNSRSGTTLLALLRGDGYTRSQEEDAGARVLWPGRAEGPCYAACLRVLSTLCGTATFPDLRGSILAIEDIDERPFLVDFALQQLAHSGALKGIVGLLCGSFSHRESDDYAGPSVDEVLAEWARKLRVPTVSRLPFGHIKDALCLPCGRPATLTAGGDEWSFAVAPRRRPPPWLRP